jgi:biotin transport system substrate-specific component
MEEESMPVRKMIIAALFTALLIIATQFRIPIGPVPITMQPFVVMLAGLVLGSFWGATSVGLWALLGVMGLPVFAGGKAGLATLMGPTGGFIIGFIMCAYIIGLLTEGRQIRFWPATGILLAGLLLTYIIGLGGFLFNMQYFLHKNITLQQGIKMVVLPFIPADILKAILAAYVGVKIKNALGQLEQRGSNYGHK